MKWRVGRSVGRTIYLQVGPKPSKKNDKIIGLMDTPELAKRAVEAVNAMGYDDNGGDD